MITPKQQKEKYSIAQMIAAADAYFHEIGNNSIVLRKPFDHPSNTNAIIALMATLQQCLVIEITNHFSIFHWARERNLSNSSEDRPEIM